jgi:hypothetical protein
MRNAIIGALRKTYTIALICLMATCAHWAQGASAAQTQPASHGAGRYVILDYPAHE